MNDNIALLNDQVLSLSTRLHETGKTNTNTNTTNATNTNTNTINNNIEEARNTARAEYVILEESLKNAGKTNTNTNSTSILILINTRKNLAY